MLSPDMKPTIAFGCSALALLASLGCSATPPPNWASGGAPVALGNARWTRDDEVFELKADGSVMEDDDVLFRIDQVGRVYEDDGEPVAVLLPNGHLVGNDDVGMGEVGPISASFPGAAFAWLSIGPQGQVIRYDSDGGTYGDGGWDGCAGPVLPTCTLVTHLIALREWERRPRVGVGVGVGVAVPLN
jgi:hypothetical protein